jgi:hypothetical protein
MSMNELGPETVTRRNLLIGGFVAAGGAAALVNTGMAQDMSGHDMSTMPAGAAAEPGSPYTAPSPHGGAHGDMMTVGTVDHAANGFDPTTMLTEWETGTVSTLENGRTLRTFEIEAIDKEIEIAPRRDVPGLDL